MDSIQLSICKPRRITCNDLSAHSTLTKVLIVSVKRSIINGTPLPPFCLYSRMKNFVNIYIEIRMVLLVPMTCRNIITKKLTFCIILLMLKSCILNLMNIQKDLKSTLVMKSVLKLLMLCYYLVIFFRQ